MGNVDEECMRGEGREMLRMRRGRDGTEGSSRGELPSSEVGEREQVLQGYIYEDHSLDVLSTPPLQYKL